MFGSVLDGLFGGGESTSESKDAVWETQVPHLENIFNSAQDLYGQGWQAPGVADFNTTQNNAMNGLLDYANTTGANIANTNLNTANQLMGGFNGAQNYYTDLMNGGANFNANANQFINSDLVNQQINAANNAVDNQFNHAMTGIASQSAGGGNTGSTRRAAAEAMMASEAAKAKSNNVANIHNNAYQNAMSQMNLGASNMINMAGAGADMLNNAYSMGVQPFQTALNVGGMQQDMTQSQYDWMNNNSWDLLGRYQAAVGAPTVLGSSSQTSTQNANIGGLVGGLANTFFG